MGRGVAREPGRRARAVGAYLARSAEGRYTQIQLAAATGISQSNISDYFAGKKTINVDQLQALCDALGLDIETVMRDTDAPASAPE